MKELIGLLFKKYGLLLSEEEVLELLEWFKANNQFLNNDNLVDFELQKYLFNRFKGRKRHLFEQDNSSLSYLLMLLRKETIKARGK